MIDQKTLEVWKGNELLTTIPAANEKFMRGYFQANNDDKFIRFVDPLKKEQLEKEKNEALKKMADFKATKENAEIADLKKQLSDMQNQMFEFMKSQKEPKTKK